MAKLERTVNGDFNKVLDKIQHGILNGSISATLEGESDFRIGDARCSVRVFERFSFIGSNRVSMSVTLFQNADSPVYITATTSGGSQARFIKINTLGEDAFLEKLTELL